MADRWLLEEELGRGSSGTVDLASDTLFFPAADAVRADAFEADTGAYHLFKAEAAHYRSQPAAERAYADSARRWLQPQRQTYLAQIYLLSGDLDTAVATLRPRLTFPSWITPAGLASDPV
ncbi:MAG: hypothetical protein ACREOQ_16930 [Gemmatimonadales bacterium]